MPLNILYSTVSSSGLVNMFEERDKVDIGSISIAFYSLIFAYGGSWVICSWTPICVYISLITHEIKIRHKNTHIAVKSSINDWFKLTDKNFKIRPNATPVMIIELSIDAFAGPKYRLSPVQMQGIYIPIRFVAQIPSNDICPSAVFVFFTRPWVHFFRHPRAVGLIAVCKNILGAVSIRKTVLPGMAIPMLKIRRPNGRLIFNMEIAIRR